jgi:hypothetical protein
VQSLLTVEVPQTGDVFTDCGRRLLVFCATDPSYFGYDVIGGRGPVDAITRDELRATFAAMRAFSFYTDWRNQKLIGEPLPHLQPNLIPVDSDLIDMSDDEWAALRPHIEAVYRRIIEPHQGAHHRIRAVAASKVLYLKRPHLFAIVDSRVAGYLHAVAADPVATAMAVTDAIRALGRHGTNRDTLAQCADYLSAHPLGDQQVSMTKVRMLDALIWMKETNTYRRLWEALGWEAL